MCTWRKLNDVPVTALKIQINKKVLLRERKRHTARRVAIAISCYSGGGGGSLDKIFFSQSEHVSSRIWCQKFFPLLGGGGPSTKNFFPSLNMYQARSGVKNFSLYWGGGRGPSTKNFFPSLNMYQARSGVKNFSLYWGGGKEGGGKGVPQQKFFFPV